MPPKAIQAGDVVMVLLPSQQPQGHEQEGLRPAVLVGLPPEPLRFPVLYIVPLTSRHGAWAEQNPTVYPSLAAGSGGLPLPSVALLDQMRALDLRRVQGYLGSLEDAEYQAVARGLNLALTLER